MTLTSIAARRIGLAALTAAALFGAAQIIVHPSSVGAQAAPEATLPAAGRTLSATGIGQIPGEAVQTGGAMMMAIEERASTKDVQAAVKTVQDRVAKLRAALVAVGIPDSAIHAQGFNIGPMYGYPIPVAGGVAEAPTPVVDPAVSGPSGGVMPVRPLPPPAATSYTVNAQLMVDTNSPEQLATAMRVAIEGGATNVNSYTKGGPGNPSVPDVAKLTPAIREATEQAKAMATASADAAGVKLGTLQTVTVLPPTPSWNGGPGPVPTVTWQVQVKVT